MLGRRHASPAEPRARGYVVDSTSCCCRLRYPLVDQLALPSSKADFLPVSISFAESRPRANTASSPSLPNYSSTRLPTYSSLSLVEQLGLQIGGTRSADGVTCASCEGRGGRAGTGNRCYSCDGSGRPRRRSDGNRSVSDTTRCEVCSGRGCVFSQRDTCPDCAGTGGLGSAAEEQQENTRTAARESDPPPPYVQ